MKSDLGHSATYLPYKRTHSGALFFSDTHLLHHHNGAAHHHLKTVFSSRARVIYAVGDIIDFEAVDQALSWATGGCGLDTHDIDFDALDSIEDVLAMIDFPHLENHLRVLDSLIYKADEGAEVVWTPGNHDIGLDRLHGREIGGIHIRENAIYQDERERRFWIEHGHLLDPGFLQNYQGWYKVGSRFLDSGLWLDHQIHKFPPLKGAFFASNGLKKIGKMYVNGFVDRAMNKVKDKGVDGIICGHIHKQAFQDRLRYFGVGPLRNVGATYINCGDGLTHGTYVSHSEEHGWQLQNRRHIDEKASVILAPDNILAEYRERTLMFLQTCWEAHLARKRSLAKNFNPPRAGSSLPEAAVA